MIRREAVRWGVAAVTPVLAAAISIAADAALDEYRQWMPPAGRRTATAALPVVIVANMAAAAAVPGAVAAGFSSGRRRLRMAAGAAYATLGLAAHLAVLAYGSVGGSWWLHRSIYHYFGP